MNKTTNQIKTAVIIAGLILLFFLCSSQVSAQCVTGVSSTSLSFSGSGGTQTVGMTIDSYGNCDLSIMPSDGWISWDISGNTLYVSASLNTGSARSGSVVISSDGGQMQWEPYEPGNNSDAESAMFLFIIDIYQASGCVVSINTHPVNQTVCEGSNASFSVSATGTGLSYQWQHSSNGGVSWSNISGATGSFYSFSTTIAMNNYRYRCIVSSSCGASATSNAAILIVNQIPAISPHPLNQSVPMGSPVTFSVTAFPEGVAFQWRKEGVNLSGATLSIYTIDSVDTQHVGSYSCVVTSSCGVVTSEPAQLQINQAPQPDQNRNYIHTMVYREALGASPDRATLDVSQVSDQIAYFDGLGRPSQTVAFRQSSSKQDIVVPVVYDALGRQDRQILPYVGESNGSFKPNALAAQEAFYLNSVSPEMRDSFPFSRTVFESSPLNRVLEQGAPGEVWQPVEGSTSGRTIKYDYLTNIQDEVKLWKVSQDSMLHYAGSYTPASLYVTVVKDENWTQSDDPLHTTREYKDFQGRVVLKRTFVREDLLVVSLDTYYAYDDFGLLRYVLSPEGTATLGLPGTLISPSDSLIKAYCYYYRYDARRRMIEKQLPGASAVYMVYDNRDRLVLVQDGVRRENGEWAFTKYDVLNRPVATGIYIPVTSIPHQQAIDVYKEAHENAVVNLSSATGYTIPDLLMGPDISIERLLTLTYYDNYLAVTGATGLEDLTYDTHADRSFTQGYSDKVKGLVTATRVKILNNKEYTDSAKWVGTVSYYDDRYRVIQTRRHLFDGGSNGKETASTQYDFTGQVRKTRQYQQFGTDSTTVHKEYDYDHAGRLETVKQVILEDNPNLKIELVAHEYDVLGQLSKKQLHVTAGVGFQKTDYKYNIRGWLTGMNDPHNLGGDLFAMKLLYNDVTELNANNEGAQFNGNISGWIWQNKNSGKRAYSYNYDALNRLQESHFMKETGGTWDKLTQKYEEKGITYDQNGNIQTMLRTDSVGGTWDNLAYHYKGNQLDFINGIGTNFQYDPNGNMIFHGLKGFEVEYNQLNLPGKVSKSTESILYIYTAMGEKVAKRMNNNEFQYYTGGFEYNHNRKLKMIHTEEGFIKVDEDGERNFHYNYYLKDHLGNVRVVFEPEKSDTVWQYNDYYAFGLRHSPDYNAYAQSYNDYLYNQKELQDDVLGNTGLNWYDYGARFYDPGLGRFHTIDPLAADYDNLSPYGYCAGNPIKYIDVNGEFIGTIIGTVVGGVAGAYDSYKKGGDVWAGAAEGAVSGAIAGATVDLAVAATVATGGGALVVIGAGAAAGAIGGAAGAVAGDATGQVVTSVNKGSSISNAVSNINTTNMADKAKTGAVTGAIGGAAGGAVGKGLQAASNSTKAVQGTMSKNITETAKTLTKMGADEKTVGTAVNKITTGMGEAGRNTVNTTNKVAAGTGMATESAIKVGQMQKEEKK